MVLPLIGAVAGGLLAANASKKAARTQANAAQKASDASVEVANRQIQFAKQTRDQINQNLSPYREAGQNALDIQSQRVADGFQYQAAPGANDAVPDFEFSTPSADDFRTDPGYQFAFEEGQRAIDGSAAARGNLFSGATLKAQQRFGQGLADQNYRNFLTDYRQQEANAANDFRQQQANAANDFRSQQSQYNALVGNLAASGQNAAAQANNAATNTNQFVGNALAQAGNAQAQGYMQAGNAASAGIIGAGNALNTGINNAIGAYQYMQNTASPTIGSGPSFTGMY